MKPYMKSIRSLLAGVGLIASLALPAMSQVVYFDDFNDQQNLNAGGPYTQTLGGSSPTTRSGTLGGSSTATWLAGVEAGGWGQRDYGDNNVATPTSSNFLAFTPTSGQNYTVQMTIDTTGLGGADPGGSNSWFTVGFTSSQHHWNGVDAGTIDVGHLVRWNSNAVTTITYTVAGSDLVAAGIGYVGWITDRPGTVNLNGSTQIKIDNFTLAVTTANPSLTYDGNGFDAGTVPVDPASPYTLGATATVAALGDMARSGHTFMGWNSAADGSGTNYAPGSTFTIYNNTTLYAKWLANTISVVTYNGNGNTGGSAPVDSNLYDSSTNPSPTVLGAGTLTKANYSFAGWNTAADGSGTSYIENDTFAISANTTLYAIWTPGPDFVWNNSATTDIWNTSDTNWSGAAWVNSSSHNAIFTTGGGNVSLESIGTVANALNVGTTSGNFTNFGLYDGGGDLTASSLTVQGYSSNGGNYGANPMFIVNSTVTLSGDAAVGRANLAITGGSFTANRIISAAASADWARLVVSGGTVIANNGVDGSVNTGATFAIDLNDGELQTPFIKVADREVGTNNYAWLTFNGGTIKAIGADNANFITTYGGGQTTFVEAGGAIIDTNGFNIGVNVNMVRSGASTGGLTKNGAGTLTLGGSIYSYRGDTLINEGALSVAASSAMEFTPTTNGTNNSVSAGSSTATLSFLGQVNFDLSAADTANGNIWNLFNVGSFSTAPVLTPNLVNSNLGAFTEVTTGTWERPVTGAKWVFTVADGNLTYVVTATPYESWGLAYGLTAGSESGDLDNDGLTNFEEFAFGLIPDSGTSVQPIVAQLDPSTRSFSYTRRDLSTTDLVYSVWYSSDLQTWTEDTAATEGSPTLNGDVETVPVTLSTSVGEPLPSKLFIQVRAQ